MEWKEKLELLLALLEHIDYMLFVKNIVLGVLISAIVSIVAVVYLRKYILVKRRHWSLKILSYIWLIGIPIFSMYTGFKYGLVNAIHKNIEHEVNIELEELSMALSERIGTEWASALTNGSYQCSACENNAILELSPSNAIDILIELVLDQYKQSLNQLSKNEMPLVQKIGLILKKTIELKLVKWGVKKGIHQMFAKVGLTEKSSEILLDTKMNELLEDGVLSKIVMIQLNQVFGGVKKSMFVVFFLVLLLPIGEVVYAHYYLHQKEQEALEL